jgi:hypothetical protein
MKCRESPFRHFRETGNPVFSMSPGSRLGQVRRAFFNRLLKHPPKGDDLDMDNDTRLHFVEASRKAVDILLHNSETARLYQLAVKRFGEGELQLTILNLVSDVMEDENLQSEIFASDASLLSFFSGIWIQFLLVEIAGIQKEKLHALAQKIFDESPHGKYLH